MLFVTAKLTGMITENQEVSVETALKVLEQNPQEGGKQKTFVRIVEQLLPQIGLTASNAKEGKSINVASRCSSLYNAGLYELGDKCLRSAVKEYAKKSNRMFIEVIDNAVCEHRQSSHLRICRLRRYGDTVPENIINFLGGIEKQFQKHLYVMWSEATADPWIMFRIPEKNKNWRFFCCVEIMRWE